MNAAAFSSRSLRLMLVLTLLALLMPQSISQPTALAAPDPASLATLAGAPRSESSLASPNWLGLAGPATASAVQSAVTWNSFLGGHYPADHGLAVDGSGNLYVIGMSGVSWGTPVHPFETDPNGTSDNQVFVAKLNSAGMLLWHTFLGCPGYYNEGASIAVDGSGNVYLTGASQCSWQGVNDPVIPWGGHSPNSDGFVAKLDSSGALAWNTFLGAGSGRGMGIAVDAGGDVYVTGDSSTDWGSSPPSFAYGNSDAFVAKFNSDGDLLWNGFLSSYGRGIAVDNSGVYVTGTAYGGWGTPPIRPRASYNDAFVAKLSLDGTALLWHTFLGGDGSDEGWGITAGADGVVYIVGSSGNSYGSGTWGAPVRDWSAATDAFVAKLSADGALAWNTFLGGGYTDYGYNLAADAGGNVYVVGESSGSWGAPVTPHAGGTYDAFVAKLDNGGALQWNTFVGTAGWDYGHGVAVDASGSNVYVAGASTESWQGIAPPVRSFWRPSFYPPDVGYTNVFVARLAPDYQGLLLVGFDGPGVMRSPGQTVSYAISYADLLTETVTSAVLVAQLPVATEYLDNSGSGIYWPERHQVFWKLGDLAPQARGVFSVRARYRWGLPDLYYDGGIAMLAGIDYGQTGLDVTPYLGYVPTTITGRTLLTAEQFAAERAAHPDLETLYSRAVMNGYVFREAASFTLSSSTVITRGVLVKPDRSAAVFLSQQGDSSEAATLTRTTLTIEDVAGGVIANRQSHALEFFGDWEPGAALLARAGSAPAAGCDYTTCRNNCVMRKVTTRILSAGIEGAAAWVFSSIWPPAGVLAGAMEAIEIIQDIAECTGGCDQNPATHCCTQDAINPTTHPLTGEPACQLTKCADSAWDLLPEYLSCGGWDTRCVAAGGCRSCSGATGQQSSAQKSRALCAAAADGGAAVSCNRDAIRVARDPNAKYGPEGDLTPGQLVNYAVTYENEGTGRAYGVYITDQLDEGLDETTLIIQNGGVFEASSRMITWDVGELGPKGDADSKGQVTFAVRLKNGLPGGTAIGNEAVVYFPSVPERTPTGMVVNTVQPVTAVPQSIETPYGQPVAITLSGHDVGGASLTYTVTAPPLHGELGGDAPALTYTPAADFSGSDHFTFLVSNGVSDSRPADVLITVQPSASDTIAPVVTWVDPAADATAVPIEITPFASDATGSLYRPAIGIAFSETMSRTTVTTDTIQLAAAGKTVPIAVSYDSMLSLATVYPQEALQSDTAYSVIVTTEAQDQAGNGLAVDYQWSFHTRAYPVPSAPTAVASRAGNEMAISWQHATGNASYKIWRSTTPYFTPGEGGSIVLASGLTPSPNCTRNGDAIACTNLGALTGTSRYFYLVQALNPAGAADSGYTGAFGFALRPGE